MFFRSRKKVRRDPEVARQDGRNTPPDENITVDFDMMLKGSVYRRASGVVKQVGVTVDGSTRLITSGDIVDRRTYDALLQAGVVRPVPEKKPLPHKGAVTD